jgi:thioredoxin 1
LNERKGIAMVGQGCAHRAVFVLSVWMLAMAACGEQTPPASSGGPAAAQAATALPRLIDLGSKQCIPCKKMAPILEELKKEYAGKFDVEFIDVWLPENKSLAAKYEIQLIPTQIFFDASGKERLRHEGLYLKDEILAKWKELGFSFAAAAAPPAFERLEPAARDARPKDAICYMCDGDIVPRTLVTVKTDKGKVRMCGPHCYFILYSCLTEDKTGFEKKVSETDWVGGKPLPGAEAVYLVGVEEKTGRPWIKAFVDRDAAAKEMQAGGGSVIAWEALQEKELSTRCGFCDRAVYPADAAAVKVAGLSTWGCCSHCAMGVAARAGKDIEVRQPDRLTGEMIVVRTEGAKVVSLEPPTAVAWFGLRKKSDGTYGSAGCFHQGFFTTLENLKTWVEKNPTEGGKMISIQQALDDKLKLTPQQIQKACKIGECAPK